VTTTAWPTAAAPAAAVGVSTREITMRPVNRILLALAALGLGATYFAPLWKISLQAPQYPEGLRMFIWSRKMTGDLRSINGLNHYIGMHEIHPEAIPELRLMPVVVGGLIALGLIAAVIGRRRGLYLWTGLLLASSAVGLADFWRWGYRYGHELDPSAAIKIPGMSYQPPLIGPKQLLNFQATSWPATAGWIAMAAAALAVILTAVEWRRQRRGA
jgi:copper chaperone NosL